MYVFCDKTCIDEFRRTHYIMAQCVYCKIEKVVKEVKRINNVDCSFCSEGEVLLWRKFSWYIKGILRYRLHQMIVNQGCIVDPEPFIENN